MTELQFSFDEEENASSPVELLSPSPEGRDENISQKHPRIEKSPHITNKDASNSDPREVSENRAAELESLAYLAELTKGAPYSTQSTSQMRGDSRIFSFRT